MHPKIVKWDVPQICNVRFVFTAKTLGKMSNILRFHINYRENCVMKSSNWKEEVLPFPQTLESCAWCVQVHLHSCGDPEGRRSIFTHQARWKDVYPKTKPVFRSFITFIVPEVCTHFIEGATNLGRVSDIRFLYWNLGVLLPTKKLKPVKLMRVMLVTLRKDFASLFNWV